MGPTKLNDFITEEERISLVKWAYSNSENMLVNRMGLFRRYCKIQNLKNNELALTIANRISDKFSLDKQDFIEEPTLGSILSVIAPGGFVHTHKHKVPESRFNLIVQLPTAGGEPMYNGVRLSVKERDLLCYRPDLFPHGATKVQGNKDRIIISYGWFKKSDAPDYMSKISGGKFNFIQR